MVCGAVAYVMWPRSEPSPAPTTAPAPVSPSVAEAPPSVIEVPREDGSSWSDWFPADDPAWAWARVDLDDLREELPDNAFWELAVPTDDPAVKAAREATRERWNRELGKVMSNTATEAEVRAFYDERARVSSDYVAFIDLALDRYRDTLPPRDVGLLQLARTLHLARLEEVPRRVSEAIARRDRHAAIREQWLADEAAFGRGGESPENQNPVQFE